MPAAQPPPPRSGDSEHERFAAVAAAVRQRPAAGPRVRPARPTPSPTTSAAVSDPAAGGSRRPPPPAAPPARGEPATGGGGARARLSGRRAVGAGALALVVLAVVALLAVRAARSDPAWAVDGALVVDASTGQRYLVDDQVLRAAPNLTAALLAGADGPGREVDHDQITALPPGAALQAPGDLPERPPALPDPPTGLTACTGPDAAVVEVYASAPVLAGAGAADAALVAAGGASPVLLTGGQAHPITPAAITALGLAQAPVREVAPAWLELTPPGPTLEIAAPTLAPERGLAGIGSLGEVVADPDGQRYLVTETGLAPAAGPTAAALAPPPVRTISAALVANTARAEPFGAQITPAALPRPADPEATLCTASFDAALSIASAATAPDGAAAAPERALPGGDVSRWHGPPGAGALLAPADLDTAPAPRGGGTGIVLVERGAAHRVATLEALAALGYARQQTVLVPAPWLALAAPASEITLTAP